MEAISGGPKPDGGRAEAMRQEIKGVPKEKSRIEWTTADRGTRRCAGLDRGDSRTGRGDSWERENITQGMSDPRMALPQECRGGRVMTRPQMRRRMGVVTVIVAC